MMLIILTILLPVVQPMTDECQALEVVTGRPDNLTELVKKELEKQISPKNLSHIDGIATHYVGYPDTSNAKFLFTALCLSTTLLDERPYCLNVTLKDEKLSSAKITEEQFLSFYRNCSNNPSFELPFNTTTATTHIEENN